MNQADVTKLMSQLRIAVRPNKRHLKNVDGPEGRLLKLRKTVTALVKHERIELFYNRADEARGYAELVRDHRRYAKGWSPNKVSSPRSSFPMPYAMGTDTKPPWNWRTIGCWKSNWFISSSRCWYRAMRLTMCPTLACTKPLGSILAFTTGGLCWSFGAIPTLRWRRIILRTGICCTMCFWTRRERSLGVKNCRS